MSISKIKLEYTGGNKQSASVVPDYEKNQYITAEDLNKIKNVVNTLSDDIEFVNDNTPTNISELTNDVKFITSGDIQKETIYVTQFPASGVEQSIYVDANGEAKMWVNNAWKRMSYEVINVVTSGKPFTVPTTQAVYDFLNQTSPVLPENITTQGNVFNTENNLVKLVNGKIPSGLYSGEIQHIFEVSEFATSGLVANSLYINSLTKETKFYNGNTYIDISLETVDQIFGNINNNTLATTEAIANYISSAISGKADTSNLFSGSYNDLTDKPIIQKETIYVNEFPTSGVEQSIYVNNIGETRMWVNNKWKPISYAITDNIDSSNEDLPTTTAVINFITNKINEITMSVLSFRIPKISNDIYSLELDLAPSGNFSNTISINSITNKKYFDISTGLIVEKLESINDPYSGEILFFNLNKYLADNVSAKQHKYFRFRWKNSAGNYSSYGFGKTDGILQVFNPTEDLADNYISKIEYNEKIKTLTDQISYLSGIVSGLI